MTPTDKVRKALEFYAGIVKRDGAFEEWYEDNGKLAAEAIAALDGHVVVPVPTIILSQDELGNVISKLENPPAPTDALKKLMKEKP